jgi:hypothetical protein
LQARGLLDSESGRLGPRDSAEQPPLLALFDAASIRGRAAFAPTGTPPHCTGESPLRPRPTAGARRPPSSLSTKTASPSTPPSWSPLTTGLVSSTSPATSCARPSPASA